MNTLRTVQIWDFAHMNFVRTLLSKRKLSKLVESGIVWGWDGKYSVDLSFKCNCSC